MPTARSRDTVGGAGVIALGLLLPKSALHCPSRPSPEPSVPLFHRSPSSESTRTPWLPDLDILEGTGLAHMPLPVSSVPHLPCLQGAVTHEPPMPLSLLHLCPGGQPRCLSSSPAGSSLSPASSDEPLGLTVPSPKSGPWQVPYPKTRPESKVHLQKGRKLY